MTTPNDWNSFLKAAREVEEDYFRELENNKKLAAELQILQTENGRLHKKLLEQSQQAGHGESRGSSTAMIELQKQLNSALKGLREEAERIKITYPVFDLLAAKQAEVERLKKSMDGVERNHPERKTIEAMVKAHIIERDELKRIVQEAEKRLQSHLDKIHASYLNLSRKPQTKDNSTQPDPKAKPVEWIRVPEH